MPKVNIEVINKAGTVNYRELTVSAGTQWYILSPSVGQPNPTLKVGDIDIIATPVQGWEFTGNWGQETTSGTITSDKVFTVDFINSMPLWELRPGVYVPTYSILYSGDINYAIDLYCNSLSENAPLIIYGRNYTPAQNFGIFKSQDNNDCINIRGNANFGAIYANFTLTLDEQRLTLRQGYYTPGEIDWKFNVYSDADRIINGVRYRSSRIQWKYNNNYYIDNRSARVASENALILCHHNGDDSDAQHWIPMKIAYVNGQWNLPSIIDDNQYLIEKNTYRNFTLKFSGSSTGQYQVRRRQRKLLHNTNNWTPWEYYESPEGLLSDEGWGDAWTANSNSSCSLGYSSANSTDGVDSIEYQIDVRTFGYINEGDVRIFSSCSNNNTLSVITKQLPTFTIDSVSMISEGLLIEFTHDIYRTIDKVMLSFQAVMQNEKIIWEGKEIELDLENDDNYIIPYSELLNFPSLEYDLDIQASLNPISDYIGETTCEASLPIITEGGELVPEIEIEYLENFNVKLIVSEQTSQLFTESALSFIYEDDGQVINQKLLGENNEYLFCPPLNNNFKIVATLKTLSGGHIIKWGVKPFTFTGPKTTGIIINTLYRQFNFKYATVDFPSQVVENKDLGAIESELDGSTYKDLNYGSVQPKSVKVAGAVYLQNDWNKLASTLNDGYCLLRTSLGRYIYCGILSYSPKNKDKYIGEVDIELEAIDYELNVAVPKTE